MSDTAVFWEEVQTPIGLVRTACGPRGLTAVQVGGDEARFLRSIATGKGQVAVKAQAPVAEALNQISDYLVGKRKSFDLRIDWASLPAFQEKVQRAVYAIPYGKTRTYGEIATQVGHLRAARAVGRANATNPIPLVLPCHRLVGADGSLRGYGGGEGIKTKQWLLDLEKRVVRAGH